jgi:ferric-dicitrate binding protein FerR (iron transport regulator)
VSGPRYAFLARRLLVRRDVAAPAVAPDARERASSIAAIERAIEVAGRRRRLQRVATGAAAAAAVVACALGSARFVAQRAETTRTAAANGPVQIVAHPMAGGASLMGPEGQAPLVEGRALASGSRIVTPPNGRATLSFSTGTTASLGEGADLSIEEQGGSQTLRLAGGSVDLHVAKLSAGQRFVVDTMDTEVEVRGTRFRVELADPSPSCGNGVATRVAVTEGVVVVRHAGVESRVDAGESWPKGCAAPTGAPTAGTPGAWAGAGRYAKGAKAASDLASQNDLFADGTKAWHRGDAQGALAAFDQLLSKYPNGPVAETAWVERIRVLRAVAPERAAASAREYLARYPSGSARPEAEALLQSGSP